MKTYEKDNLTNINIAFITNKTKEYCKQQNTKNQETPLKSIYELSYSSCNKLDISNKKINVNIGCR